MGGKSLTRLFFFLFSILVFWELPKGNCPYQSGHRLRSSDRGASSDPDPWNIQVLNSVKRIRPRARPFPAWPGGLRHRLRLLPIPRGAVGASPAAPPHHRPQFPRSRRSSKRSALGGYLPPSAPESALSSGISGSPCRFQLHQAVTAAALGRGPPHAATAPVSPHFPLPAARVPPSPTPVT